MGNEKPVDFQFQCVMLANIVLTLTHTAAQEIMQHRNALFTAYCRLGFSIAEVQEVGHRQAYM